MSRSASGADAVSAAEARTLFAPLVDLPALLIAVSGGPDSTALLLLLARWRAARKRGPALVAATVDHGLRPQSAAEARAVKRLAARLGVPHRTLRWTGDKPATGVQEAARDARYRLLAKAARSARAAHVVTAHTRDDQAETVLIRMARGSGLTGLRGMTADAPVPHAGDLRLVRPLLDIPKARLVATLRRAGLGAADDPSNADPRFTRIRIRRLMPALAEEGLNAERLALLARRLARADAAIEAAVLAAETAGAPFRDLPEEVALRLLGRAVAEIGRGAVPLGKLESLMVELVGASGRVRRTLGGALVTLDGGRLSVVPAPPRRRSPTVA